jgi:hypothetical protein
VTSTARGAVRAGRAGRSGTGRGALRGAERWSRPGRLGLPSRGGAIGARRRRRRRRSAGRLGPARGRTAAGQRPDSGRARSGVAGQTAARRNPPALDPAVAGAGERSRCPGAAGARCRTARTPVGRAGGWDWFQIKARSSSSRRQVCTHRSMIEFILGIRTPLSTVSMPASVRMASNWPGTSRPSP